MSRGQVGVAPGTTTLKLPDGSSVALADWIDDKMYGCVQFNDGQSAPVEAFASGRSQTIPGGVRVQTRVDTNIPRNGDSGLPKDWEMLVYGIGIKFTRAFRGDALGSSVPPILTNFSDPTRLRTIFEIDRVCSMSFEYNNKSYSQGTMSDYPAGNGYSVFATTASFELAQNGITSPRDRVALVLPIHMRENLGFKCAFQPEAALIINQPASDANAALAHVDVKTYLYGLVKRTVV